MTTMRLLAAVLMTLCLGILGGCSRAEADDPKGILAVAKDNMKKAEQYHKLANDAKLTQAKLQGFVSGWLEECKVRNMQLQMQQDGDPACVEKPPTPPTPTPAVPPGGPVTGSGLSRPSTTNTPITPAKQ